MLRIFNDQVDSTCLHSMSIFMESQFPGKMKKTKNGKSHIHLLDCAIICFIITLEFHFHQLAKKQKFAKSTDAKSPTFHTINGQDWA